MGCKGADPLSHPEIVHPGRSRKERECQVSRIVTLIALALAAAAVAASIATADTGTQAGTTVDPLAVSMLLGKGYTPTAGRGLDDRRLLARAEAGRSASGRRRARISHGAAATRRSARAELPDSVRASPPSEVTSWTVGSCSHEVKASSCYAMFQPTATLATGTIGFSWGDAGIGAAATLGIVLLLGGLGAALISRRGRPDPTRTRDAREPGSSGVALLLDERAGLRARPFMCEGRGIGSQSTDLYVRTGRSAPQQTRPAPSGSPPPSPGRKSGQVPVRSRSPTRTNTNPGSLTRPAWKRHRDHPRPPLKTISRPVTPEVAGSSPVAPAQKAAANARFFFRSIRSTRPLCLLGTPAFDAAKREFQARRGIGGRTSPASANSSRASFGAFVSTRFALTS